MTIYAKLLEARKSMSFEKEYNEDLKYEILDADTILEMVGNALAANGILFVPSIMAADMSFSERVKEGRNNTTYTQHVQHALATLELTFIDVETGDVLNATTHGSALDFGDKALGKAQTYAIKYFFTRMFLKGKSDISDEENMNPSTTAGQDADKKRTQKAKTAPKNAVPPQSDSNTPPNGTTGADSLPTIRTYWPNVAPGLLAMLVSNLPDGVNVGGIIYPQIKHLGYPSDDALKTTLGLESLNDWTGTLEQLMVCILDHAQEFAT